MLRPTATESDDEGRKRPKFLLDVRELAALILDLQTAGRVVREAERDAAYLRDLVTENAPTSWTRTILDEIVDGPPQ